METQGCSGDDTDCLRRRQSRHHGHPSLLRETVRRPTSLIYSSREQIRRLPGQARLCVSAPTGLSLSAGKRLLSTSFGKSDCADSPDASSLVTVLRAGPQSIMA